MKLLIENFRKFLNESVNPKIKQIADGLPDDVVILARKLSTGFRFIYVDKTFNKPLTPESPVWGRVDITNNYKDGGGECLDGWIILTSKTAKGWGPLLYEVALEWSSKNGSGLMSDRTVVSKDAEKIWDIYMQRGDVEKKQLDVFHNDFLNQLDDIEASDFPQLTPDNIEDDCLQIKAIEKGKENWMDTPFAKLYVKGDDSTIKYLKEMGKFVD